MTIPPFYRCETLPVVDSTNEALKRAALAGAAQGQVLQALRQTAGKGRQGRVWDSPEGNLFVSVLLRPNCTADKAGRYTFVAALAVHDAVAALLPKGAKLEIKWPNDVLVEGKKISGILLEASPARQGATGCAIDWLVLGVGINVRFCPEQTLYPTASLAEQGAPNAQAQDALEAFLNALEVWRLKLEQEGFEPVRQAWMARARKGSMRARLQGETVEGTFVQIDPWGRLILRLAQGAERAIAAGDVFFSEKGKG